MSFTLGSPWLWWGLSMAALERAAATPLQCFPRGSISAVKRLLMHSHQRPEQRRGTETQDCMCLSYFRQNWTVVLSGQGKLHCTVFNGWGTTQECEDVEGVWKGFFMSSIALCLPSVSTTSNKLAFVEFLVFTDCVMQKAIV